MKIKDCEYCRGAYYTNKDFEVKTPGGNIKNVKFHFCPECGREIKENYDPIDRAYNILAHMHIDYSVHKTTTKIDSDTIYEVIEYLYEYLDEYFEEEEDQMTKDMLMEEINND